jgi:predicted transport protein
MLVIFEQELIKLVKTISIFFQKHYMMSTAAIDKATQTQIANIEKNTGKKLEEWIAIVNNSGFVKHGELVGFLKEKHGFTHGNANVVVHFAKQSHAGAAENNDDLVTGQYKGKENLKPWYDKIMTEINKLGSDIELAPKKAYVSLRRKKQFAIIQPSTKDRLDVGINVKGAAPAGIAAAAGSWNAMCTLRIKVESEQAIGNELFTWLKQAYEQAG